MWGVNELHEVFLVWKYVRWSNPVTDAAVAIDVGRWR